MKKILVVDDSALMRRVLCDIINSDQRFTVADEAINGEVAFDLLSERSYDAVVLDVNMPKMNGLELLRELRNHNISARVLMASTITTDGAKITMDALELGALDFIHKPEWSYRCKDNDFAQNFLSTLEAVCNAKVSKQISDTKQQNIVDNLKKVEKIVGKKSSLMAGKRVVALACSTGGPKALQQVIPYLSKNLNAPLVVVQHMPVGFTASLASRLDQLSNISVNEAQEGDVLKNGCVYISRGGKHLNLVKRGNQTVVHYSDEPSREGVKPCANYMYESLADCDYEEVICVVLTGMGADGTAGISNLKKTKKTYVITQDMESCVVYGMPKSVVSAGLSDQSVELSKIAQEIILHTGVKENGC